MTGGVTFRKLDDTSFPLSLPPSVIFSVYQSADAHEHPVVDPAGLKDGGGHPGHMEVMEGEINREL